MMMLMMRRTLPLFVSLLASVTAWTPPQLFSSSPRRTSCEAKHANDRVSHMDARAMTAATLLVATLSASSPLLPSPATAATTEGTADTAGNILKGEQLFKADCAECHAKVKNLPGDKTSLSREALAKYRNLDQTEIKDFVQNEFPHNVMPFQYSDQDHADVSAYVVEQALDKSK